MRTTELRDIILQYVSTADDKLLKIIKAVFESYEQDSDVDFFDELPKEVQELLKLSREQVKEGKVTSHKEVMAKYRDKYNVTK